MKGKMAKKLLGGLLAAILLVGCGQEAADTAGSAAAGGESVAEETAASTAAAETKEASDAAESTAAEETTAAAETDVVAHEVKTRQFVEFLRERRPVDVRNAQADTALQTARTFVKTGG